MYDEGKKAHSRIAAAKKVPIFNCRDPTTTQARSFAECFKIRKQNNEQVPTIETVTPKARKEMNCPAGKRLPDLDTGKGVRSRIHTIASVTSLPPPSADPILTTFRGGATASFLIIHDTHELLVKSLTNKV